MLQKGVERTEHAVCMRAMEPWRSCIRRGLGSLSLIRLCSVEGPRGAKLELSCEVDVVGDAGRESPLPAPGLLVSSGRCVIIR